MAKTTEVVKLRRNVLTEVARLTFAGELNKKNIIAAFDTLVSENGPRYRCCVHKERAILRDRLKFVMGQPLDMGVEEAAHAALEGHVAERPIINIMPEACDQCPIDKFFITNACRNCVAHSCINSCPKNAISVWHNQAYIDKQTCIECGICKSSCQYGAIVEINRPCEHACDIGAVKADKQRRAVIDYDKCVQCGGCKVACPFGAIVEQSFIVQLIQQIKAGKRVYGIMAPAFIGQFGAQITPGKVIGAMHQMGFYDVWEASFGADIVTMKEAEEFAEKVPGQQPFMTTSCCPSFVDLVNKHMPQFSDLVSSTVSPMVAAGKVIKEADPGSIVVFVGPCTAKKAEAQKYPGIIDFVITFEELASLFKGAGIDIAQVDENLFTTKASRTGNNFAKAGGVTAAVLAAAAQAAPGFEIKPHRAEGLKNCRTALLQMKAGKIDANFFEGMTCAGGCVGGPGTLNDIKVNTRLVENFAASSSMPTALDNTKAVKESQTDRHWHYK